MCKKSILAVWLATCSLCIAAQEVVSSDQWAATDALGRTVGRYDGTQQDKQVFMFYWTWHQRHEAKGTMHGFDTVWKAPTTQRMVAKRIAYIKQMFHGA